MAAKYRAVRTQLIWKANIIPVNMLTIMNRRRAIVGSIRFCATNVNKIDATAKLVNMAISDALTSFDMTTIIFSHAHKYTLSFHLTINLIVFVHLRIAHMPKRDTSKSRSKNSSSSSRNKSSSSCVSYKMHKFSRGQLHSGTAKHVVSSRSQAIAIALQECSGKKKRWKKFALRLTNQITTSTWQTNKQINK